MALTGAELGYVRCPRCRGGLGTDGDATVRCSSCAATFPVTDGIVRLLPDDGGHALASRIEALDADMRRHDWAVAKMSLVALMWVPAERVRLLASIDLRPGDVVLDHCTGPGANLPTLADAVGPTGRLVGMDLSGFVLRQARATAMRLRVPVDLHQADASALPYADETFDAVVHYGALNQLGDRTGRAIEEILRVTKPGGRIVLLDEGLARERRGSWWGRLLMWGNPLFAFDPPLHLLPAGVEPEVRWVIRGMFYEIRFRKPRGSAAPATAPRR
jgi:SAM-dependent methyltransferase